MTRSARLVYEGFPHHIVQRGNRSQKVFFSEDDKSLFKRLLQDFSCRYGLGIWAYCLMDNHLHLIAVPEKKDSLALSMGAVTKRYTDRINFRENWKGSIWQGRFRSSIIMSERYLYAAIRYVERNPVRAGIVKRAEDFKFSSASHHVNGSEDYLVSKCHLVDQVDNWADYLDRGDKEKELLTIRSHAKNGRPLA